MTLTDEQITALDNLTFATAAVRLAFGTPRLATATNEPDAPGQAKTVFAAYDGTPADALAFVRRGVNPFTGAPTGDVAAASALVDRVNSASNPSDIIPYAGDMDPDAREFLIRVGQVNGTGGMMEMSFNKRGAGPTLADAVAAMSTGGPAGQG